MNYTNRLLELICDKLDIDYSDLKATALTDLAKLKADQEKRKADFEKRRASLLSSNYLEERNARAKRVQELQQYDKSQISELEVAYLAAKTKADEAWKIFYNAQYDGETNQLVCDRLRNKWRKLDEIRGGLRADLDVVEGVGYEVQS